MTNSNLREWYQKEIEEKLPEQIKKMVRNNEKNLLDIINKKVPKKFIPFYKDNLDKKLFESLNDFASKKSGLFLYGGAGTGKTLTAWVCLKYIHLRHLVLWNTPQENIKKSFIYSPENEPEEETKERVLKQFNELENLVLTSNDINWNLRYNFWKMPELSIEIKNCFNTKTDIEELIRENSTCDYLFLDDLGVEKMTDFVYECFYQIIDFRHDHELPTFITSNYSIKQIAEKLGDRITSRIVGMCKIIKLDGEDKRLK